MLDLEFALSPAPMRNDLGETHLSDGDIVPDEIQNELISWRDAFTTGGFRIGDIANMMIDRASRQGWVVTNDRIYRAVGKFCGKSGRTIRYYAETSAFYPANIRSKYDVLPFSHFVFARTKPDRWESILDYAAENPEKSLSEVMSYITGEARPGDARDQTSNVRNFATFMPSPQAYTASKANVVGDLLTALDRFERALPNLYSDNPKGERDMVDLIATMRKWARNLTADIVKF